MSYVVTTLTIAAAPIAAVRRRVRRDEIASTWKPALDQVWAFLRTRPGLRTDGHNVFLYHHPARQQDAMDIDFGVQVTGPFAGEGEIMLAETPAGEVVTVLHRGPYDQLGGAHDAIHAWRAANQRAFAGSSWEIYSDWSEDPAKLETQVLYLLR